MLAACKTDQERADEAYERGLALLAAGDEARARVEFRNATTAEVNHVGAQTQLGRLFQREGATRAAFRAYLRVAEADPTNLEAVPTLARIAFRQQEWDIFERYALRALELAPADPGVKVIGLARQYRQAVLDKDQARRQSLLAEGEALSAQQGDDMLLRFVLIDSYVTDGRPRDALAQIDAALATDPKNPGLHTMKLQVLGRLEDIDGIGAELHRAVEVFPNDKSYKEALMRYLVTLGRVDEAEAFLRAEIDKRQLPPGVPEENDKQKTARDEALGAAIVDLVQFLKIVRGNDAALAELQTRLTPETHKLRALRATLDYEMGRRDAAISEMETLVGLPEDALPPEDRQNFKVVLAGMLAQNGNEVGARRTVEEVLQTDPNNVEALKFKAVWLIDEDKTAEAVSALRTALAASPDDTAALTLMARAHERAGNTDLMLESLALAVDASKTAPESSLRYAQALVRAKRLDQAESVLVAALRLVPEDVALLTALGQVQLTRDNRPLARQTLQRLAALTSNEARRAAADLELRLIEREQGTEQALQYLGSLAGDENERAKLALIRAQLLSGKTDEALAYANELVAARPDDPSYRYFRALARAAAQDYAAAEQDLTELLRKNPKLVQPWLQLARLRGITDSQERLQATLDEALAELPDAPDILWAKASFLERNGDIDGAIAIYDTLYRRDSAAMVVANNLASLLATYRDDPESLARAEVIARRLKDSELPALQDTYGWILFRNGKATEALTYLEPAAKGLPGDPVVQAHLGRVYHALGRLDEARTQLDLARTAAGERPSATVKGAIAPLETALTP